MPQPFDIQRQADIAAYLLGTSPADGQLVAWSASLQAFTPVNAPGAQRIAAAANVSGTLTNVANGTGGSPGTAVAVPGTTISIPTSNGIPVVLRFGVTYQQTAAGAGVIVLAPYETTTTPTTMPGTFSPLVNSTAVPTGYRTVMGECDIGIVASTRTFQLYAQLWSASGITPFIQLLNTAQTPSFLRASGS